MRLLVVDDDTDLREVLADVLTQAGHEVWTAGDGLEALASLAQEEVLPDAIVLDWKMPRMGGEEFRRRQLAEPRISQIPVVLMSASSVAEVPVERIAPDAVLCKPVTVAQVLRTLADVARPPQP